MFCTAVGSCVKLNLFPGFFLLCIRVLFHAIYGPYILVGFMAVCTEGVRMFVLTATKQNSVALVRTRTIPTERPPPVGEVSANFCG